VNIAYLYSSLLWNEMLTTVVLVPFSPLCRPSSRGPGPRPLRKPQLPRQGAWGGWGRRRRTHIFTVGGGTLSPLSSFHRHFILHLLLVISSFPAGRPRPLPGLSLPPSLPPRHPPPPPADRFAAGPRLQPTARTRTDPELAE